MNQTDLPTNQLAPRVLIVEDHKVLAETLALALRMNSFDEVRAADDLTLGGVLRIAGEFKPEVTLLDLHLNGVGLSVPMIGPLVAQGSRVLIMTPIRDQGDLLAECLEAGAAGLFDKGSTFDQLIDLILDAAVGVTVLEASARDELIAALRRHRAQEEERMHPFSLLSERERDVLQSMTEGKSAEEIASTHFVSIATIRSQIRAILQKLGVNSQLAAVALASRAGWEQTESRMP